VYREAPGFRPGPCDPLSNFALKFNLRRYVMDRILENISLDNLARLLVDVHIDSSKIMESLLSNHQRDLLDMIFLGGAVHVEAMKLMLKAPGTEQLKL